MIQSVVLEAQWFNYRTRQCVLCRDRIRNGRYMLVEDARDLD